MAVCEDVRSYRRDQESLASISDEVICEGCEALMATVKEYLANDEVVQYIEKEADQLCQYCPEQQECENAINTYLPVSVDIIYCNYCFSAITFIVYEGGNHSVLRFFLPNHHSS